MQLGRRPAASHADDIASALVQTVGRAGDRPALCMLRPDRREEQGFRTFAQWVAKGAHLLEVDHGATPGDSVHLDSPACWAAAAVACACWWVGAAVTSDPDGALLSVVHERRRAPASAADCLWLGDAIDGGPTDAARPSWTREVAVFPDAPPAPRAAADLIALRGDGEAVTQRQLLQQARELGGPGRATEAVGLANADVEVARWLALAVRPLATGAASVFVDGASEDARGREPVAAWLDLLEQG